MKGNSGRVILICEWIVRLAMLNFLWILYTILGFIVLGAMPATIALFSVVRKWINGETLSLSRFFWLSFRENFLKANLAGILLFIIGFVLYFDYQFLQAGQHPMLNLLSFIILFMACLYFVMLLYFFPIFVHYELSVIGYLKNSLLMAILYPKQTFLMITALIFVYYIGVSYPVLIPFFGPSILALLLMWFSKKAFLRVEQNKRKFLEGLHGGVEFEKQ